MKNKIDEIVTSDLTQFGDRERYMAEQLLKAWREQGLPKDFYEDEGTISFNKNSGCVFLTNSEYQAAMMNGDKLESWYNCPECGHEGFLDEMEHGKNEECCKYLDQIMGELK